MARIIRRLDCWFTRAGWRPDTGRWPRSDLRFEMEKPRTLERVTDLTYALNAFLQGEQEMGLIHITMENLKA